MSEANDVKAKGLADGIEVWCGFEKLVPLEDLKANPRNPNTHPVRRIEQEEYRQWLVDLLRPHRVILITARPDRYGEATLARITELTDWAPEAAFFAEISSRPHQIEEHLLKTRIFPKYGDSRYFGLESNPHTRSMYARYGIGAVRVTDQELMILPG